jgi:hypothetical protein
VIVRRAVAAAFALVAAIAFAGCGGGDDGGVRQALAWKGTPEVFQPGALRRDRVLVGTLRNASGKGMTLRSAKVVVRDGAGRRLPGAARFTNAYAHGLFGVFQQPSALPDRELARLGYVRELLPDAETPVFVAWRQPPGTTDPVRVELGPATLRVPARVRPTAG